MRRVGILSVTRFFASMLATVVETTADVRALEGSGPLFDSGGAVRCSMTLSAILRILTIAAHDILLNLTAVTACRDTDVASPTGPLVAWS